MENYGNIDPQLVSVNFKSFKIGGAEANDIFSLSVEGQRTLRVILDSVFSGFADPHHVMAKGNNTECDIEVESAYYWKMIDSSKLMKLDENHRIALLARYFVLYGQEKGSAEKKAILVSKALDALCSRPRDVVTATSYNIVKAIHDAIAVDKNESFTSLKNRFINMFVGAFPLTPEQTKLRETVSQKLEEISVSDDLVKILKLQLGEERPIRSSGCTI
jgi:hypothetical protein